MEREFRKNIRLKNYDYAQAGGYFITICTRHNKHILGKIVDGKMILNQFGKIVQQEWLKTFESRDNIELDQYVVMPNHFHAIFFIIERSITASRAKKEEFGKPRSGTLSTIIRSFKSAVTRRINEIRNTEGEKVWQPNYYEHIIRNKKELDRIRKYIVCNPLRWEYDKENDNNIPIEEKNKFWQSFL